MAERLVRLRQPATQTRVPVLVVCWPPVREGAPWLVEVRAPRGFVTARVVSPPIANLDDPRAELLGERFVAQRIPQNMRELLLPGAVVASENLRPTVPSEFLDSQRATALIRGLVHA